MFVKYLPKKFKFHVIHFFPISFLHLFKECFQAIREMTTNHMVVGIAYNPVFLSVHSSESIPSLFANSFLNFSFTLSLVHLFFRKLLTFLYKSWYSFCPYTDKPLFLLLHALANCFLSLGIPSFPCAVSICHPMRRSYFQCHQKSSFFLSSWHLPSVWLVV